MNKITVILFIIQLTLLTTSCTKYDQRLEIKNLSKPQVLILQKKTDQKIIVSMRVHCYGKVEGEAQLVLMLNGAPYKTEKLNGKVNFKWGGDWYADSMELRYRPDNITSGQLVIDYTFSDL
jgi:hypothetical protein